MALLARVPEHGCEHLNQGVLDKVTKSRLSLPKEQRPGFAHYSCLQCHLNANLPNIGKHLSKSKHDWAVSVNSLYCGQCKDLVYEVPSLTNIKKRKLSVVTDEDDSYLTSNSAQRPCGREGVRGLFNLGETCYMNAVLQMMVHNPLLTSYFLGSGHPAHTCPIANEPEKKNDSDSDSDENSEPKEQKTCIACGMTDLFSDAKTAEMTIPANAVNLLFASWKAIPHMAGKSQQDAQEWFMMVVDKLHETIKPTLDKKGRCHCFFHRAFFGRLRSEVTCDTCGHVSRTQEPYSSISLDFKKQVKKKKKSAALQQLGSSSSSSEAANPTAPNILECLRSYTAPESLPAEEYKCHGCGVARSASKRLRIRKLPAILCVHVKRFGMKVVHTQYKEEKYAGKIDFPLTLNMRPFTTKAATSGKREAGHKGSTQPNQHGDDNETEAFTYDLESVVVHQGEQISNGHYFAFCRQQEEGTRRWYRFDDEIVSATTTEEVLRQEAYLLFYALRKIA